MQSSVAAPSCWSEPARLRNGALRESARSARSPATALRFSTDASAERRPDVDHAVVLDRHEGSAQARDHILRMHHQVVAVKVRIVAARNLDAHLVHRAAIEPGFAQLL